MRRFAEENEARVADAIEERVDRGGVDVVDRLGGLANERRETCSRARAHGALDELRRIAVPRLLADQGHEANIGERLLRYSVSLTRVMRTSTCDDSSAPNRDHETAADASWDKRAGGGFGPPAATAIAS